MKRTLVIPAVLILAVFFTASSFAQRKSVKANNPKFKTIEANYLEGLNSNNLGLKISSAYFLGDMKSEKAVIPLMRMFDNAKTDGEKLVAAWALLKIGDARGTFLVKRECEVGNCDQIRSILYQMYTEYNNGTQDNTGYETVTAK